MNIKRRAFISFLGKASLGTILAPQFLTSCGNTTSPITTDLLSEEDIKRLKNVILEGLLPSDKDDLLLAKGLNYHSIIKWNEKLNDNDTFGFNNDFTCFIPLDKNNPKDGLLWVNHEYVDPLFV